MVSTKVGDCLGSPRADNLFLIFMFDFIHNFLYFFQLSKIRLKFFFSFFFKHALLSFIVLMQDLFSFPFECLSKKKFDLFIDYLYSFFYLNKLEWEERNGCYVINKELGAFRICLNYSNSWCFQLYIYIKKFKKNV